MFDLINAHPTIALIGLVVVLAAVFGDEEQKTGPTILGMTTDVFLTLLAFIFILAVGLARGDSKPELIATFLVFSFILRREINRSKQT